MSMSSSVQYSCRSEQECQAVIDREIGNVVAAAGSVSFVSSMQSLSTDMEAWHRDYFALESDPTGTKWAPLSPYTIKRKGHDIRLQDRIPIGIWDYETGVLKESLGSQSEYSVRDIGDTGTTAYLVFGTSVEYATYHQTGTSRMPARPPVGLNTDKVNDIANRMADAVIKGIVEKLP